MKTNFMANRISSFDAIKILAAFAVVCLHAQIFQYSAEVYSSPVFFELHFIVQTICRFAVPFFFMVSGYFFAQSIIKGAEPRKLFLKYTRRFLRIFVGWSIIYLFLHQGFMRLILDFGLWQGLLKSFFASLPRSFRDAELLLLRGTEGHLWFLPSLWMALWLITYAEVFNKTKYLFLVAIIFYVIGCLGGAYANMPFGYHAAINTRHGPFFSVLFVVLGWHFARHKYCMKGGLFLFLMGLALQIFEAYILRYYFKTSDIEYSLSTIIYGAGLFILALNNPDFGKSKITELIAPITLGIYLAHRVFVNSIDPFHEHLNPVVYDLLFAVAVFVLSIGLSLVIKCQKNFSWLVE